MWLTLLGLTIYFSSIVLLDVLHHRLPAIVRYRVAGLKGGVAGLVVPLNRVIAKVSRVEVATKFLSPPSDRILKELVGSGHRQLQ